MPRLLLTILTIVLIVVFRRWLLRLLRRVFRPGVLLTFCVMLFLVAAGMTFWYWWNQPSTAFYGAQWQDTTDKQDMDAIKKIHFPQGNVPAGFRSAMQSSAAASR